LFYVVTRLGFELDQNQKTRDPATIPIKTLQKQFAIYLIKELRVDQLMLIANLLPCPKHNKYADNSLSKELSSGKRISNLTKITHVTM